MEGRRAAGTEVVGFESDKAEGVIWGFPEHVAEPSELRSKSRALAADCSVGDTTDISSEF